MPEDESFRFVIADQIFFDFEIGVKFKNIQYSVIYTDGYFYNNQKKTQVCYFSPIYEPLFRLHDGLKKCFSGKNLIKPGLFENGVGHYWNLKQFYINKASEQILKIEEKFPLPSTDNQPLELWTTPYALHQYQVWLYRYEDRVYIELGEIFDNWSECDKCEDLEECETCAQTDKLNFQAFIQNYRCERFEIKREQAQSWIDYMFQAASYSKQLSEDLNSYLNSNYQGLKGL